MSGFVFVVVVFGFVSVFSFFTPLLTLSEFCVLPTKARGTSWEEVQAEDDRELLDLQEE